MSPSEPKRDEEQSAGAALAEGAAGATEQASEPSAIEARTRSAATDMRLKLPEDSTREPAPDSGSVPFGTPAAYIGTIIDGRYCIDSLIGEGGMGWVYRARHRMIDKLVAIKILRPEVARDRDVTERFLLEAKAASAIGNPHIVDTLDFGHLPDGSTYFVMEYLEGKTLSAAEETEAPFPIGRIVYIAKQIAEGLSAAHAAAIVHRDLKPENVFLVRRGKQYDFVKILDFGIAKVEGFQSKLTHAGAVFGTPHYMSPEQASGATVDHRSDVYALGVILYELAAGRVPFDAEAPLGILAQHLNDDPIPPSAVSGLRRMVPRAFEAVILKCLAKDRTARYQSMNELIDELESLESGYEPRAVREAMQRRVVAELATTETARRRRPVLPWLASLAVAGFAVVALYSSWPKPAPPLVVRVFASSAPRPLEVRQSSSAAAHAPTTHAVALVLAPIDAHVFRGNQDLGAMPVTIQLGPGEKAVLEVRRRGYHSEHVVVDGSEPRRIVRLTPIAAGPNKPPPARPPLLPAPPTQAVLAPSALPAAPTAPVATGAVDEPAASSEPGNRVTPPAADTNAPSEADRPASDPAAHAP